MYQVRVSSAATRDLDAIPPRYIGAIVQFMFGLLATNPHRVGKPLERELEGLHSARRGDYRIIYEIHEDERLVLVARVDHRARIYRPR